MAHPSTLLHLDDSNFDTEVQRPDSAVPVLIDFGARWCPPCRALRPIVERLAGMYAGRLRVAEVNVDEAPEVARRLGIRGTPTVVVFRGGREVARQLGATSRERLLAMCGLD